MFCVGPEPGHLAQRAAASARRWQARLARGQGQLRHRDRHLLVQRARGQERRGQPPGHQDRGLLLSRRRRSPRPRAASPTPSACSSGTTRRPTRRATAAPTLVHLPARQAAQEAVRRQHAAARPGLQEPVWDFEPDEPAQGRTHRGRAGRPQDPEGDQRLLHRRAGNGTWPGSATSRTTARPPAPPGSTAASSRRRTGTSPPAREPDPPGVPARSSTGAGPGRPTAGSSTTAPRPTRRAAVERAQEVGLVGRRSKWTGLRRAGLPADQGADAPQADPDGDRPRRALGQPTRSS